MNKLPFYLIVLGLLIGSLSSCYSSDDEGELVNCTLEFRIIGLSVIGDSLTDFYTVRKVTGDTIRLQDQPVFDNFYPVLNDSYQQLLENKQEDFSFIGLINDSVRVNQLYVIKADQCHIEKLSGVTEVTL